jgi:hypothetical protein
MKSPAEQGRSGISTIAEYAVHELQNADKLDVREILKPSDAILNRIEAARSRVDAERFLDMTGKLVGSAETELVPAVQSGERVPNVRRYFLSTCPPKVDPFIM